MKLLRIHQNQFPLQHIPSLTSFVRMLEKPAIVFSVVHLLLLVFYNLPDSANARELAFRESTVRKQELQPFAKCLSDRGVVMFGSEKCPFCQRQKELFGSSFQNIRYIDCDTEDVDCAEQSVVSLPTWIWFEVLGSGGRGKEIERHTGVLTLQELAAMTGDGCTIANGD